MIAYLLDSGGLLLRLQCTSDDNRKCCGASKSHFGVLHNLDVSLDQVLTMPLKRGAVQSVHVPPIANSRPEH